MSSRVLAVEDTPSLRALLELSLARAGYRVELAEDGQAALDLFMGWRPDAVVMDIQMPVMDGLTAVEQMRLWEKREGRAPAPILALTANTEPADLKRCLDAGFTATVRKPFAREELLTALARALGTAPAGAAILVTPDPEFAELIPQYLANCRADAAAMRASLEHGDFPAIVAVSHRLRGSGASFGFDPVTAECRKIEAAAKKTDASGVAPGLEALDAYLRQVKVVLP